MRRYRSEVIHCFVFCFFVIVTVSCNKINGIQHTITPSIPEKTLINISITPSLTLIPTAKVSPLTTNSPVMTSTPIPTTPSINVLPTQTYQLLPIEAANQIRTMLIGHNGDLWTGGPGGVVHWDIKTGQYTVYTQTDGLANNDVTTIAQTHDDVLWFGTFGGGISSFDGQHWQTYTTQDGLPGNYITSLTVASDGGLWVDLVTTPYKAEPNYACHFGQYDGQHWIPGVGGGYDKVMAASDGSFWASAYRYNLWHFNGKELDIALPIQYITDFSITQDGIVWAATSTYSLRIMTKGGIGWEETPAYIYRIVNNIPEKFSPPWLDKTDYWVTSITFTPKNTIWFGLSYWEPEFIKCGDIFPDIPAQGVYSYNGKDWTHFTSEDGLADNNICAAVTGLDGSVWFGTYDKGVSRFDGHIWKTYSVP